jgi:GNAT superfamily N-acetyltransferase
MSIEVVPFSSAHVGAAAASFSAVVRSLRHDVPALSATFADPAESGNRLSETKGVAALEAGRLVGYLTSWFPISQFRRTHRIGAYVPEWGHGVWHPDVAGVYAALYREAAREWADAGCDVHAITLLDSCRTSIEAWFRMGFGMLTVDAVRSMAGLDTPTRSGVTVRAATVADASALAGLDLEHIRHYAGPPIFMSPPLAADESTWSAFLADPRDTAWLAELNGGPVGFIRFGHEFKGSDVIEDSRGVFIAGAYVRPEHRRRGVSTALLDAGLRHYASAGLRCCALDFESFNPEAAAFWLRHFTPVCSSLMRVPEVV